MHDFSFKIVLSHSTESFRTGTILCFRKFRVSKNFMPERGISPFSIENLLSDSTEKLCRGTVLCFTKFLVSKKNMDKRGAGREGVSQFSVENFLSHSAETFRRGEFFSVSLISGIEKFYASEGYVTIFDFLSNFSCLTAEKFGRWTLLCCVSENFW